MIWVQLRKGNDLKGDPIQVTVTNSSNVDQLKKVASKELGLEEISRDNIQVFIMLEAAEASTSAAAETGEKKLNPQQPINPAAFYIIQIP